LTLIQSGDRRSDTAVAAFGDDAFKAKLTGVRFLFLEPLKLPRD
jgi:hypothetical protein